jgi:hypothetical protein
MDLPQLPNRLASCLQRNRVVGISNTHQIKKKSLSNVEPNIMKPKKKAKQVHGKPCS